MADSSAFVWPPKCRFGARCWRPACAYHHEESDERRQHLAQLASPRAGCAPCVGHVQSNDGVAVCLAEVSGLREVVKKLAASIMWSNGAPHLSSKVGMDHPAFFDSCGVHVTGRHDEKPYRQAGVNAYQAGASCADDSPAQLKSERETGSVLESGMDDSNDNATPQRGDGLANNDALSDAGESSALILTRGTNSPRGTSSSLDLPMERVNRPDGKQSGMFSSLVSRWESEARSQSPGQGSEPSSCARMAGPQLSCSQEDWASNTEAANNSVSTSMSAKTGKPKALPNSRRRGARPGRRSLICKMVTARWQLHRRSLLVVLIQAVCKLGRFTIWLNCCWKIINVMVRRSAV